jgi:hypothetical protein
MNKQKGFLVVLRTPRDSLGARNARYRGIDRLPPYSPSNSVPDVLDDYVFGKYKDESGLIPNLSLAKDLLSRFSAHHEALEIIYVREYEEGNEKLHDFPFLGFDIAGQAPFWSVVGDLPQDQEIDATLKLLNEHGLFHTADDARSYLQEYRTKWLADPDLELSLWEIYLVK